jgi:hypothetical protein
LAFVSTDWQKLFEATLSIFLYIKHRSARKSDKALRSSDQERSRTGALPLS